MRLIPRPWRVIAPATLLVTLLAAGCDLPNFGAPDAKAEQGQSILQLWRGFFIAGLFVAALVWGLLIWVLLRYRRSHDQRGVHDRELSPGELPNQSAYNIPMEVFYTAAPVVVVAGLFGFSWVTERNVNRLDDDPAVEVEVVGFQWSWEFRYPDEHVVITGEPDAPPELVLPVDQPSQLKLVSNDVNHAFWVPDFLSKRDLIPGVDNTIEVTPTETGTYQGRCAEFCGLDHWEMYFSVRVVSEDDYETWLDDHRSPGDGS